MSLNNQACVVHVGMSGRKGKYKENYTPQHLQAAITAVKGGKPVREAASEYGIPVMTLWRYTMLLSSPLLQADNVYLKP